MYVTKEKVNSKLGKINADNYLSFKYKYFTLKKMNDRIYLFIKQYEALLFCSKLLTFLY